MQVINSCVRPSAAFRLQNLFTASELAGSRASSTSWRDLVHAVKSELLAFAAAVLIDANVKCILLFCLRQVKARHMLQC